MISIGRALIFIGLSLTLAGVLLLFMQKIPFLGKLPGDIRIQKENFSFYFPVTTCLILSGVFSFILWLFQKK